ncbi:MAG: hypothetical protein RMK29_05185 [Myxococcales bacterium]|nr:hypothetical protein [Myxococcota bacterium]MDW8281084.1 hypothetical protein [Myxococcales bacterium]
MLRTLLCAAVGGAIAFPAPLHAGMDLSCGLVEAGSIHIDGLVSDWEGVDPIVLVGAPPGGRPLRVRLRCNYDERAVYLLIEVEDDVVVRTPAAGPAEDHVQIGLAVGGRVDRLLIYPGLHAQKQARRVRWQSGHGPRVVEGEGPAGRVRRGPPAIEVYDALRKDGYAIEMRLPFVLLPGHRAGVPLPLGVRVVDGDSWAHPQVASIAETSPLDRPQDLSRLVWQEAESALTQLLQDLRASRSDIWWERDGDIGGGPAQILLIGRYLGVVGKEYGWQELAPSRADIREVQLVDIGNRQQAVAVRVSETGGGGQREVLRLYRLLGGRFQVIFAAEVAKQVGDRRLSTQVRYVRRGQSVDLVLWPQPPVGFTPDTYHELPASDVEPILLPWQDRRVRYVLGRDGRYARATAP